MIDASPRRARGASRILYWFRTPPGVRVGGVPLDTDARRLIESRHPDVSFDWRQILSSGSPTESAGDRPRDPAAESGTRAGDPAARRRRRERLGPAAVPIAPAQARPIAPHPSRAPVRPADEA